MLKYYDDRYMWQGTTAESEQIKALGFIWDNEYKLWYTKRAFIANKIKKQVTDKTTSAILRGEVQQETSTLNASEMIYPLVWNPPRPKGLEYLPFQKAGIDFITKRDNTLLADDMGLGKTVQAIGALNTWPNISKILIVCPATVKLQWRDAIEEWCTKYFNTLVVMGRSDERINDPHNEIVIINYDIAKDYACILSKIKWDVKIVDEMHYLMTEDAQRTMAVLGAKAKRNIFLSGTPAEKPYEMWSVLRHLDPENHPKDGFWNFASRYCDPKYIISPYKGKGVWIFKGATNLEEFQYGLRSTIMIRRLKSQVLPQLGEKTRTIVPLDLGNELSSYLEYERHVVQQSGGYDGAVDRLTSGELDADENMATVRRQIGVAKVPLAIKFIDDLLLKKDKLVIAIWHKDVAALLAKHYGKTCVVVNGSTTPKKKEANKRRFIDDPTCKLYIGQIASAGTGVDGLQLATDTEVFVEVDWSFKKMVQFEDRIHRHGQDGNAMYYYLVVDESLESYMVKKLQRKKSDHKGMFDTK